MDKSSKIFNGGGGGCSIPGAHMGGGGKIATGNTEFIDENIKFCSKLPKFILYMFNWALEYHHLSI